MIRSEDGLTIIELVIALSLASLVLVGVAAIATRMARSQMEGIKSGTTTGWSLVSYMSMAKEIEEANVLAYPSAGAADTIVICKNWSRSMNGGDKRLDTTTPVSVVQYCVDPTAPVPPETGFRLRRYANVENPPNVGCPTNLDVPAACVREPAGTWTQTGVVGFRLEKLDGLNVFLRDDGIGGVRLRYVIGRSAPSANDPNPKSMSFNFGVAMQKQYSNTND